MPNTINNKCKAKQLFKIEKEFENIELRKRMSGSTKGKASANKKETVWERLSKVKKISSSENALGITRSRNNLTSRDSHRLQTIRRQMVVNNPQTLPPFQGPHLQTVNCKPLLTKNGSSNSRFLIETEKSSFPKNIVASEIKNEQTNYTRKPKKSRSETMTSRSLTYSKSSADDCKSVISEFSSSILFQHSARDTIAGNKEDEVSLGDSYESAPLMSSRFLCNTDSNTFITNKLREMLQDKNKSMTLDDLELVKNVIKSDHRYQKLNDNNPKLFKYILRSQLEDILKQEFAVKSALEKLDSSVNLNNSQDVQTIHHQFSSQIVSYTQNIMEPQKLEVDVIFKNVPSLEKEIIILRALGEKLEATLKSSNTQRVAITKSEKSDTFTLAGTSLTKNNVLMVYNKSEIYVLGFQHYAQVEVRSLGIAQYVGVAKEFLIAQKTIVELKQEANRPFYIPINPNVEELKRTSFQKLKYNPDLLLRHIKAKNSMVAFNVLEQDPVFFNNILFNMVQTSSKQSLAVSESEEYYVEKEYPAIPSPLFEAGDNHILDHTKKADSLCHLTVNTKEICCGTEYSMLKSECNENIDEKSVKLTKPKEAVIRGQQRRRIRGSLTPMPCNKNIYPKNSLIKTIIVGFIQMQLFIFLILVFTYPGPKCPPK